MDAALKRNVLRLRNSTRPSGRAYRAAGTVAVPRVGKLKGRAYIGVPGDPEDFHTVSFADVQEISAYLTRNVHVRVGSELRRYLRGAPMGEPGSCAQANGVSLDGEQTYFETRKKNHGDAERIATLGFVDDIHFRFGYDRRGRTWTKASAEKMLREVHDIYPPPLALE